MPTTRKIRKRDGSIEDFNPEKITEAIWDAAQSVGGTDKTLAEKITGQVETVLGVFFKDEDSIPSVEQIHDLIEKILIENGHAKTAKAYILARHKDTELRGEKDGILGLKSDTSFSVNSLKVLKQRYLLRDDDGNIIETPEQMVRRVAANIAEAERFYKDGDKKKAEEDFYRMMIDLDFLPNSPTLMNAGTTIQQLAACFVLPVKDSIESIFETLKNTAIIQQTGGGTGFNFSGLRPRGDLIHTTKGISTGPVSFIKIFDSLTGTMKEGGKRRGANMGILEIDHPDIIEFISSKEKEGHLENFNISIGLTDKFMQAVENDQEYSLVNPRTGQEVNRLSAKGIFDLIVAKAWENGEPGVLFMDRIEQGNTTPSLGRLTATNTCGEQPLLPYEACNLGSVNISNFVKEGQIDWERLKTTVHLAVHFLDNTIDMSDYKLEEIKDIARGNRKIGLGIMGFADLLFALHIPYNSSEGLDLAENLMSFVQKEAKAASEELGQKRGNFPNFDKSIFPEQGIVSMRNATVTTIAPAGTLSMIAETSPGIEPVYAIAYTKSVFGGTELAYINRYFKEEAIASGIYSEDLIRKIARHGSLQKIVEVPQELKKHFVVSSDIEPEWHIRMQAAFQRHTDNAVSKTINLPEDATHDQVRHAYLLAYRLGCKGITVYRDKSRKKQVMYKADTNRPLDAKELQSYEEPQTQLPLFGKLEQPKQPERPKAEEIIPPPIINTV